MPYITLSRLITATILFVQFVLYSSSFVSTLKNEILGAALELCQLKIEHFSPDILKFNTKHKDNPFTLLYTVLRFPALFCLYFMQARVDWVLRIFGTQVTKKNGRFGPCFQTVFPFLMTMQQARKNRSLLRLVDSEVFLGIFAQTVKR